MCGDDPGQPLITLKIAASRVGSGPHLIHVCFLGPIRVYIPNGISIGSVTFVELTVVSDRLINKQTDHASPSVTSQRIDHATPSVTSS